MSKAPNTSGPGPQNATALKFRPRRLVHREAAARWLHSSSAPAAWKRFTSMQIVASLRRALLRASNFRVLKPRDQAGRAWDQGFKMLQTPNSGTVLTVFLNTFFKVVQNLTQTKFLKHFCRVDFRG